MQPNLLFLHIRRQLSEQGAERYLDPISTMFIFWPDVVEDVGFVEWDESLVIEVMRRFLKSLAEDKGKDAIRHWAFQNGVQLDRGRWKDIHVASIYQCYHRISEGIDRNGQHSKRYYFGGKRVDEKTYHTLTCEQSECPRHKEMFKRFEDKLNGVKPSKGKAAPIIVTKLEEEREVEWQGQKVLARKAKLVKVFTCPVHEPVTGEVEAWDLFDKCGTFIKTTPFLQ